MSSFTPHLHPGRPEFQPELQLTFCERTLSPISTTISDSIETTSSSYATADGLGTDFGRFLNWIGTRLLDAVIEIVIQRRLLSIATYISHRGRDQVQLNEDPGRLQAACADLLELCRYAPQHPESSVIALLITPCSPRPIYAMKVRRKSMGLISALFHPVDHISILILHSDFVEVLAALEIDCCGADDMVHTIVDIVHIANNVRSLSCHCILCLQRFNVCSSRFE